MTAFNKLSGFLKVPFRSPLVCVLVCSLRLSASQPTFLDSSFKPEPSLLQISWIQDYGRALVQADGKILFGGLSNGIPMVIRLNKDGSKDTSFQFDSRLIPTEVARPNANSVDGLVLQPDGKVLLAALMPSTTEYLSRLVRLNPDGSRDDTFVSGVPPGQGGRYKIQLLPDGRIFVASDPGGHEVANGRMYLNNYAHLLTANGSLQMTMEGPVFQNPQGDFESFVTSVALQADGKILVAGQFALPGINLVRFIRLNPVSVDQTFHPELNSAEGDLVSAVALQSDGKILVATVTDVGPDAGFEGGAVHLMRLLPSGQTDPAFHPPSDLTLMGAVSSLLVLPDDRFILSLASPGFLSQPPSYTLFFDRDGALQQDLVKRAALLGFALDLVVPYDANRALAFVYGESPWLRPPNWQDWSLARSSRLGLRRFFIDGSRLPGVEFTESRYTTYEDAHTAKITVARTGDLSEPLAVHFGTRPGTARAGSDYVEQSGLLSFAANEATISLEIPVLDNPAVDGDRTVLLTLTEPTSGAVVTGIQPALLLIRDNESPTALDPSFVPRFPTNDPPVPWSFGALLLQPDSKILVAKGFWCGGAECSQLTRLLPDGALDPDFISQAAIGRPYVCLAIQTDQKILAGGSVATVGPFGSMGLVRLNRDGSVDTSFHPEFSFTGGEPRISALAPQSDGRILVGGIFSTVNGTPHQSLVRLNADGSCDEKFQAQCGNSAAFGGLSPPYVNAILIQSDDQIVIAGNFNQVNNRLINSPVRIKHDGTLDDTFVPGYGIGGQLTLLADRTLLSFDFDCIHRFNADGSWDSTFEFPCSGTAGIWAVTSFPGGRALVGARDIDGATLLLLIGSDGRIEREVHLALDSTPYLLAADGDRVLVGGAFSTVNDVPRAALARLLPLSASAAGVQFASSTLEVSESAGTANLAVIRTGDSSQELTIQYNIGGDATDDVIEGTLTFSPLEVTKVLSLPVQHDLLVNSNSQSTVVLTNAPPGVIMGSGPATIEITVHDHERPGSLDFSFPGLNTFDGAKGVRALAVQSDDKVLVAGIFASADQRDLTCLQRLNADGSHDNSFEAIVVPDVGWGVSSTLQFIAPASRDKIVIGGTFTRVDGSDCFGIARLQSNGELDQTFDAAQVVGAVTALAVQPDDRVLVAGTAAAGDANSPLVFRRLLASGQIDQTFTPLPDIQQISALLIQPDAKILAQSKVGDQFKLLRLAPSGAADTSFKSPFVTNGPFTIAPDGKILALSPREGRVIRFNPDGSTDSTFASSLANATALIVQSDGRILVSDGSGTSLHRLNSDGSLDLAFAGGDPHDSLAISSLGISRAGSIIVGGQFSTFERVERAGIVRLHGDPPLRLLNFSAIRFGFEFNLNTLTGRTYVVEKSSDLVSWMPVRTNTANAYSIPFQEAGDGSVQFYRAKY